MKRYLLFLTALALLLSACSTIAGSQLSTARNRWQAAHIGHYRYSLRVACFCAFSDRMPLTVEVQSGHVVSMAYRDGTPVLPQDQPTFASYQTLDALFQFTDESIRQAQSSQVSYDPTYGFPTNVQLDFSQNVADDELTVSVGDFQPLP